MHLNFMTTLALLALLVLLAPLVRALISSRATPAAGFIAKICDFGMSRLMDASKTHVSTSSMGTISYQPPELLLGQGACCTCSSAHRM